MVVLVAVTHKWHVAPAEGGTVGGWGNLVACCSGAPVPAPCTAAYLQK